MSTFDPDTFLDSAVEGANETTYTPLPEGEYTANISGVSARQVDTKEGVKTILNVLWDVEIDEKTRELNNLTQPTQQVRQDIWLDLDQNGNLLFGTNQNVRLGRLRAALGMNDSKKAFSFRQLEGSVKCLVKVTQRSDKNDSSIIYNQIDRVAAL